MKALYNIYRKKKYRYRIVRVVYRKRVTDDKLELLQDERKAKKRPDYKQLADEDASEEDEEILKDVWLEGEAAEKDRKEEEAEEKA